MRQTAPLPIFRLIEAAVDLVPGGRAVRRTLETIERTLLRELKHRLESVEAPEPAEAGRGAETPASAFTELLERSLDETPEEARRQTYLAIVRRLVPDEARILAALSDGGAHPVIHVSAASALGSSSRQVLSHVSSVGQAAGVQLRELTAHYIAHLLELGLVELGPEDPKLALKYEILESHGEVRTAMEKIARGQKMTRARILRRTIRMTALGRDLWAACQAPASEPG